MLINLHFFRLLFFRNRFFFISILLHFDFQRKRVFYYFDSARLYSKKTTKQQTQENFHHQKIYFPHFQRFSWTTWNSIEIIFDWLLTRCDSIWFFMCCFFLLRTFFSCVFEFSRGSIKSLVKSVSLAFINLTFSTYEFIDRWKYTLIHITYTGKISSG